MYARLILTVLLLVLVMSRPAQAASVEAAEFLVLLHDREGNESTYRSNVVPLLPDHACYGWRIRLTSAKGLVKFKEILSLPAEPEFWSEETNEFSTSAIATDRKTSVTDKFDYAKDRWISNFWCVAKGDPEGTYTMEVYIEGKFAKRFEFDVRSTRRTRH